MILQEDSAFLGHAKLFKFSIFASCYEGIIDGGTALILDHFVSIQPMLDAIVRVDNNSAPIPFTGFSLTSLNLQRRDQIIERSLSPVSYNALAGVWMLRIVQYLVFETDGNTFVFFVLPYKVLHAAVCSFGEFKFEL